MTDNNHPITPPWSLIQQWAELAGLVGIYERKLVDFANLTTRWGADMELKACCEWASQLTHYKDCDYGNELRTARRPKPKSLAEEALEALNQANEGLTESEWPARHDIILRALERLQELEGQA